MWNIKTKNYLKTQIKIQTTRPYTYFDVNIVNTRIFDVNIAQIRKKCQEAIG
jgi:hypothetical protein